MRREAFELERPSVVLSWFGSHSVERHPIIIIILRDGGLRLGDTKPDMKMLTS